MHSYDSAFHRLLAEAIEVELASQRLTVTERPLKSFEDYTFRVGRIDGLRMAITLCGEVERRLSGAT